MKIIFILLIFGMAFVPFTSLRFGPLGLGEFIILLVFFILILTSNIRKKNLRQSLPFLIFWCFFLIFSLIGLGINAFNFSLESGRDGTSFFDFFSYVFILVTVVTLSRFADFSYYRGSLLFERIFDVWAFTYVVLFILSFFVGSLFGFSIKYHDYYSPLVDNVHQAASVICVLGFLMLYRAFYSEAYGIARVFFAITGVLLFLMAFNTGATKAALAVIVGLFSSAVFFILSLVNSKYRRPFYIIVVSFCSIFLFFLYSMYEDILEQILVAAFVEADGGGARANLYSNSIEHFKESPLFGYGPGSHAPYANGFSDAHNTFLTILLQSGAFGGLLILLFLTYLFSRATLNFILVGALASACIYFLGGDILRRLPTWVMMLGIYYFSIQRHNTIMSKKYNQF